MDAVGRLASGIAHDFNNLLVVILGGCDYLQTQPGLPAGVTAMAGDMAEAGQRAATLVRHLAAPAPAPEPAPFDEEVEGGREDHAPANVQERLRGLSVAEQLRVARGGSVTERVVLERLYGKIVWEALLRNTHVTVPEVARLARLGTLPRPLLELIVGNPAWLQVPQVRRAHPTRTQRDVLARQPRAGQRQLDVR